MNSSSISNKNRTAFVLLLAAAIIFGILLTIPSYSFDSCVFTKKSPNTFVGDEKYESLLKEVNGVADEFRAGGHVVKVNETVTERTNSKGEKTSLVAFTVNENFKKSAASFLGAGLPSSYAMMAIVFFTAISFVCSVLGFISEKDVEYKMLSQKTKTLRSISAWLAFFAMLLVPVFVMMNTYALSRKAGLYTGGILTEGKDEFFALMDKFLFGGMADENIDTAMKQLKFDVGFQIWLLAPCLLMMTLCAVKLLYGTVKRSLLRGCLYAFVAAVCVITLYPYYVMLITGFRSNAETTDMYFMHIFPTKWELINIVEIIKRGVPKYLLNSVMIAGGATVIAMLCGIPAAYAMARMNFKGKKPFLGFVIMSQMFAPVVLLIGISQLMTTLKLNDSIAGLMFINAAFNQAFAVWLLRGTFVSISSEMEQAALIDGCNTLQSLIKVLMPMAAPGIVTALIFVFINSWNEYTISTVLISTASNRPITVGITTFSSFNMIEWQYLFAASLLATIPVVILFMFIEKHLTAGLTAGGVKG